MDAGFESLLQAANQLTAEVDSMHGELPRVERNLKQILEAGKDLWAHSVQEGNQDVQASILLGAKGYDLPKVASKLEVLKSAKTYETITPAKDLDVEAFLKNEIENAILAPIEELRESMYKRLENEVWDSIYTEWEEQKQRLLAGVRGAKGGLDVSLQPLRIPDLRKWVTGQSSGTLGSEESAYAKEVCDYVDEILAKSLNVSLLNHLIAGAKTLKNKALEDVWSMVSFLTEGPLGEGADRGNPNYHRTFVLQARKFLEERYWSHIQFVVERNLTVTSLGGVPSHYSLLLNYMKVASLDVTEGLEDIRVEGVYAWPFIYICLRAGHIPVAIEVANTAGPALSELKNLLMELQSRNDHEISPSSETMAQLQYRRSIRTSTDPYKKAVWCSLGACDPSDDHREVTGSRMEDILWIKLCQVRPNQQLTFPALQDFVYSKFGEECHQEVESALTCFAAFFLTGQFEAGLNHVFHSPGLSTHAVHIALALHEIKLLRLPSDIQLPLLYLEPGDTGMNRRLNLARMLLIYTKQFELSHPYEALHYLFLLRNMKNSRRENLFVNCATELISEAQDYETLIGKLRSDGTRTPAVIDKFKDYLGGILEMVARTAEDKGFLEDAVNLYFLAQKEDRALEILVTLLSQVVHRQDEEGGPRERLLGQAREAEHRIATHGSNASASNVSTLRLLLRLFDFYDLFHSQQHTRALDTLKALKLVALQRSEVEEFRHTFRGMRQEVCGLVPDVLLTTMNLLHAQYLEAKPSQDKMPMKQVDRTRLEELKRQAQVVLEFTGSLPFHTPPEIISRMMHIKGLML